MEFRLGIGKEEVVAVYHSAIGREPCITHAVCLHALHVTMEVETSIITAYVLQSLAAVGRTVELYYSHKQLLGVGCRRRTHKVIVTLPAVLVNSLHLWGRVGNSERHTTVGTLVEQCRAAEIERTGL